MDRLATVLVAKLFDAVRLCDEAESLEVAKFKLFALDEDSPQEDDLSAANASCDWFALDDAELVAKLSLTDADEALLVAKLSLAA